MAQPTPGNPFGGRLIAVPETRQLDVLAELLERRGADVLRCPLVAIKDAPDAAPIEGWIGRLIAAPPVLLILYTGEGLKRLVGFAERAGLRDEFVAALGAVRKLCRGPKPKRELKTLGLESDIDASAPTTAGIVATLGTLELRGRRIAVQLYGDQPIPELDACLAALGVEADFVAPYVYASAADDERVLDLIRRLDAGEVDAIAFTSKAQVERLLKLARAHDMERTLTVGLGKTCVAAIGPVVADMLVAAGVAVDTMPADAFFMKPLVTALARRFET
jgi:uroporphyrinogen-III synthase